LEAQWETLTQGHKSSGFQNAQEVDKCDHN